MRKNRVRSVDDGRLKTGPKVDAILHDIMDRRQEYAVMESATELTAREHSSKWQTDQAKMRKLMRDILGALARRANHQRRVVDHLQVIGISTAGFSVQTLRMTQPKGYTCLLKLDEQMEVPQSFKTFRNLPVVLCLILKIKVRPCSAHSCLNHGLIMAKLETDCPVRFDPRFPK
jgi:Txe/YoeB family toxin of Txe-Axe toxin-antitoxin module